jgi:hypothetical protein
MRSEIEVAMSEEIANRGLPPTLEAAVRCGVGREFVDACRVGLDNHKQALVYVLARRGSWRPK